MTRPSPGEAADTAPAPASPSVRASTTPIARPRHAGFGPADLALLFQSSLWAANYTIVKSALATVEPLAFNGVRLALATLGFLVIAWLRRDSLRFPRADLPRLVLLGWLGHGFFQACFALGLARTTAASTSLILALAPVFVALLAVLRREERLLPVAWLGTFSSFAGVAVLVASSGGLSGLSGEQIVGDLIILTASISWAGYTVLSRPLLARYSSLQLNTLTLLLGVPPLILLALPSIVSQRWEALATSDWLALGYASLLAVVVAYFIYSWGVQQLGPSRTAAYYNTTPPLAAAIAWLFGGEPLTPLFVVGAALILAGLYLIRRGTRPI